MKKLPFWKLKREASRLARQAVMIPANTWEYLTLTPWYDWFVSKDKQCHFGDKTILTEAAVYLIFPVNGVLKSHLQMLDELVRQNITPIVVSNQSLSPSDLDLLKTKSALVIERPNVGYDFGGYRDAILEIEKYLPELRRLFILNDSVWMIDSERNWFEEVREANKDLCGATSNYGIKRHSDVDFRDIKWEHTSNHKNFHYASYALALGNRVLSDPDFVDFWKRFRLSNNKKRTVRRGEIALSKWIVKRGFSHTATCDVHNLDEEIRALEPEALDAVTRNLVILENPRIQKKRDEVLESDPRSSQGISDRVKIILTTVSIQAIGYALPYYTINYRGFQFIKKSPLWLSEDASEKSIHILESLKGPLGRQACSEAHEILKEKAKSSAG